MQFGTIFNHNDTVWLIKDNQVVSGVIVTIKICSIRTNSMNSDRHDCTITYNVGLINGLVEKRSENVPQGLLFKSKEDLLKAL